MMDTTSQPSASDEPPQRCWTAPQTSTCILLLNNRIDSSHSRPTTDETTTTASVAPPPAPATSTSSASSSPFAITAANNDAVADRQYHHSLNNNHHHYHLQHQQHHHHQQQPHKERYDAANVDRNIDRSSDLVRNEREHPTSEPSVVLRASLNSAAAAAAAVVTRSAVTATPPPHRRLTVGSASSSSSASASSSSSSLRSPTVATATADTIIEPPQPRSVNAAPSNQTDPNAQQLHRQQQQQQSRIDQHIPRASSPSQSHVVTIQISQATTNANNRNEQQVNNRNPNGFVASTQSTGPVTVVCFSPATDATMVVQKVSAKPSSVSATAASSTIGHNHMMATNATSATSTPASANNGKSTYLYYMMASGQCSPSASSDTMDSGTCSDLETTPPPLPKKYGTNGKATAATVIVNSASAVAQATAKSAVAVEVAAPKKTPKTPKSFSSDDSSEGGSESSLSFDSLNGSLCRVVGVTSNGGGGTIIPIPPPIPRDADLSGDDDADEDDELQRQLQQERRRRLVAAASLPDSLLRDIRDRSLKHNAELNDEDVEEDDDEDAEDEDVQNVRQMIALQQQQRRVAQQPPPMKTAQQPPASTTPRRNANQNYPDGSIHTQHTTAMLASLRPTGQPSHKRIDIFASHLQSISEPSACYENDRFYTFHINERSAIDAARRAAAGDVSADTDAESMRDADSLSEEDSCFAGIRELHRLNGLAGNGGIGGGGGVGGGGGGGPSTIRSAKGTVRGVKNRVRNGIATFLQMQQQTGAKNYKEKDAGKVVLYTTSMGIVRQTYAKCANVKQILRTLLVKFEERDVFMSIEYQQEVRDRMQSDDILIPQLYVDGHHVGDADQVERLNESGELRQMLKPYKSTATLFTCQACGGYRLLPCPSCKGSKKSVHRNHFTTEFVALKCMNCDEVGLVKCYNC